MTGNASARARLGRLGRRNQGQNNQHNQYGPYHDDRSVYIHRACLARARTIPSMLCASANSGSSPTRFHRTLFRKPSGELLGILLLLRPLLLFFRIENPLHEKRCDQHEASPATTAMRRSLPSKWFITRPKNSEATISGVTMKNPESRGDLQPSRGPTRVALG